MKIETRNTLPLFKAILWLLWDTPVGWPSSKRKVTWTLMLLADVGMRTSSSSATLERRSSITGFDCWSSCNSFPICIELCEPDKINLYTAKTHKSNILLMVLNLLFCNRLLHVLYSKPVSRETASQLGRTRRNGCPHWGQPSTIQTLYKLRTYFL